MVSSISHLQYDSSEVVQLNIQRNSKGVYSSNPTATLDTSYFSTSCSTPYYRNHINPHKVLLSFIVDNNTQKRKSSETRLTVEIGDFIISNSFSFNLFQKPRFKKVMDLAKNVSKGYQLSNRNLISKDLPYMIHNQNMKMNLSLIIKKESEIFGLFF